MIGQNKPSNQKRTIKAPQDFVGALLILLVALAASWLGRDLPAGTLGGMGPGMMPRSVAALLGVLGVGLLIGSFTKPGPGLGRWSVRSVLLVVAAILAFAYTVRPLGLSVAAPVALLIAACASEETRWGETIVFAVVMTALCIGLFKIALRQPIPLAPWLLGY